MSKRKTESAQAGDLATAKARIEARAAEAEARRVKQLPLWHEAARGLPNEIVRSALFTTGAKADPRRYYRRETILSVGGGEVTYTGEELRTDDEDVWLQIMHLARDVPLGEPVYFTAYAFLREIGWRTSRYYYKKLSDHIDRLSATNVCVRSARLTELMGDDGDGDAVVGEAIGVSLVRRFRSTDERGRPLNKWWVTLEPELHSLFARDYMTLFSWSDRRRLTPTAKRLHEFYGSHRRPHPMKVETLKGLCGSRAKDLRRFRQTLRDALERLRHIGFLEPAGPGGVWIDPATDLVHVRRTAPLATGPLPFGD